MGIFITMLLVISYNFKPEETVKLVMYPLVGLYVIIDIVIRIIGFIFKRLI